MLMMMAHMGRNSFTPFILNCSSRWRWVVIFLMLQPLFRQRTPGLDMTLGWPLNQSECSVEVKNLLYLRGIGPRFSSP